ncbi:MAG: GlxA family transcriptional regulator [Phyllobacterium sp.]
MSDGKVRFGIIALPGFTLSALSLFLDPVRLASDDRDKSRQIRCGWDIATLTGDPVASSSGLTIEPTAALGAIAAYDYLVLVGGVLPHNRSRQTALIELLRKADRNGQKIVGLCTAAFIVAEAGLLNDRRCCVNWFHKEDFADLLDGFSADTTSLFHQSGSHFTCAGGLGAAALSLSIIQAEISEELARKSASILMFPYELLKSEQPALSFNGVRSPVIRSAIRIMTETIDDPVPLVEIARRIGLSSRQMERTFRQQMNRTAFEVRDEIRVQRAIELLNTTELKLIDVAVASGFVGTRSMNQSFRRQKQCIPASFRKAAKN